jgi:hypothetical protein
MRRVAIQHPYSLASLLSSCYPLQPVPGGRGSHPERIYVLFRVNKLKEIKWDLGSFTTDPDQYVKAFITVIQTFELVWKHHAAPRSNPHFPGAEKIL